MKKQPTIRLLLSEFDTHDQECEQREEPSGRDQCSGQVPLGVSSTVAQPWGHITQVSECDMMLGEICWCGRLNLGWFRQTTRGVLNAAAECTVPRGVCAASHRALML